MITNYDEWKLATPEWYSDEEMVICEVCGKRIGSSRVCDACMNKLMDDFAFDYLCSSGIMFGSDDMVDRIDDDVDSFLKYCNV